MLRSLLHQELHEGSGRLVVLRGADHSRLLRRNGLLRRRLRGRRVRLLTVLPALLPLLLTLESLTPLFLLFLHKVVELAGRFRVLAQQRHLDHLFVAVLIHLDKLRRQLADLFKLHFIHLGYGLRQLGSLGLGERLDC